MLIALILITWLVSVYYIGKIKIPFSIYAMIATFPYKAVMADYCPWMDTILELLLLAQIFTLVTRRIQNNKTVHLCTPVFWFVVPLEIITVLYSVHTDDLEFLFRNAETRFYIGTYLLIFFMDNEIDSGRKLFDLCRIYIINGVPLVLIAAYCMSSGISPSLYAMNNKNTFAILIFVTFISCVYNWNMEDDRKRRTLYRLLAAFYGLSVLLTKSSAAILALLIAICIFILKKLRISHRDGYKLFLAAVAAFAVGSIYITVTDQVLDSTVIRTIMGQKGYYDLTRVHIWQEALMRFKQHWLIGVGADNFRTEILKPAYVTHNDYLAYLVNYGILGFTCFLVFSIRLYYKIFTTRNRALFCVGFALMTGMYFYILTHNFTNYIVFWISAEVVMLANRLSLETDNMKPDETRKCSDET